MGRKRQFPIHPFTIEVPCHLGHRCASWPAACGAVNCSLWGLNVQSVEPSGVECSPVCALVSCPAQRIVVPPLTCALRRAAHRLVMPCRAVQVGELKSLFVAYLDQMQQMSGPEIDDLITKALEASDMLDGALALQQVRRYGAVRGGTRRYGTERRQGGCGGLQQVRRC